MTQDLTPSTIRMHATTRAVCYIYDKDFLHFQVFDLQAGKIERRLGSLTTATSSNFPAGDATLKYEISMMAS